MIGHDAAPNPDLALRVRCWTPTLIPNPTHVIGHDAAPNPDLALRV